MHCGILIQARMSSARLPGKMLMDLGGMPLAVWVLRRCALSRVGHMVALLTSRHPSDDILADAAEREGFACFRGPLEDVRQRYLMAGRHYSLEAIARVCGDSPFVDVDMLDAVLDRAQNGKADYARVVDTLPGFVSEAFTLEALESSTALAPEAVEHVTTALREHPCRFRHLLLPGLRSAAGLPPLTVDTEEDFVSVRCLVSSGCTVDTPASEVLHSLHKTSRDSELCLTTPNRPAHH